MPLNFQLSADKRFWGAILTQGMKLDSQERFRGYFEHAPFGICVSSPDGSLLQVNAAFAKMLGYSEPELLKINWSNLIDPDDVVPSQTRKERLWSGEISFVDAEIRFLARTGKVIPSRIRVSLVHDTDGNPEYFVLNIEDISIRKRSENALRESENRFRIMADGCPTVMWVTDEYGDNRFVNRAYREFCGATYEQVAGRKWELLLHPDDAAGYINNFRRAMRERTTFRGEVRIRRADGEWRWLDSHAEPRLSDDGEFLGHVGLSSDITDRRLAEHVLKNSEEKFRQLAENIREVFWIMDAAGTEMIYISPAFEGIWGRPSAGFYGKPKGWIDSIHPEDRAHAQEVFQRQVQGEIIESEYRIVQPAGCVRWIRDRAFPVRDGAGKILRLAGVAEDITERKLAETRLVHQALHDELTGLPNRRLLRERLEAAMSGQAAGVSGAVFFIDLDQFKLVNDTLGHTAGDDLLKEAACRLSGVCGESGTVARFGGDEFVLVATDFLTPQSVRELGTMLMKCLGEAFSVAGRDVFIEASVGISLFPANGTQPDLLIRAADIAMHEAKRAGKNQLKFFTPELLDAARDQLEMETRLRTALALSEFRLQFQPQFASGRAIPSRFEALLRWCPPGAQPIAPLKFIPLAEQNGLIVPIGTWVLGEACRQCAEWQTGSLKGAGVAVNVSALQFASPDFVGIVQRILATTGLSSHLLELELTESVFIADVRESARTLKRLRSLGVTIALDDFGTGYSSLSYLQKLPLDALKIDRSFLIGNQGEPRRAAVLRCIVDLAHTLGLRVVGEGVETSAQLALLGSLGCDEIQGYIFGRPSFSATLGATRMSPWNSASLAPDAEMHKSLGLLA